MGELKITKQAKKGQALLDLPFLKKLKGIKNIEVVIASILGAVVLLIYLSSFTTGNQINLTEDYTTSSSYALDLETRLSYTLSQLAGVGQVSVMITLESGPELIIATSSDQKTNSSSTGGNTTESITVVENPIIVTQNGTSRPLVLMEILPKVKGVLVVAEGADDVRIKLNLLNAIQALLEVDGANIQIFAT